jgi:hypothetical protein
MAPAHNNVLIKTGQWLLFCAHRRPNDDDGHLRPIRYSAGIDFGLRQHNAIFAAAATLDLYLKLWAAPFVLWGSCQIVFYPLIEISPGSSNVYALSSRLSHFPSLCYNA